MNSNDDQTSSTNSGSTASSGGRIRRRPPTAPYVADAMSTIPPPPTNSSQSNQGNSPSHYYGTYEGDSLLRYAPDALNGDRESQHHPHTSSMHYERRRYQPQPWYKQPQKLILCATFAWVGGVMYLASLAHSILRTQKESISMHSNMMGMSSSGGSGPPMGSSNGIKVGGNGRAHGRFGMQNSVESDEDFKEWLEAQTSNKYGASSTGSRTDATYESYQEWLQTLQNNIDENSKNKYGSSSGSVMSNGGGIDVNYESYVEWLDSLQSGSENANKYGATGSGGGTNNYAENDEDFKAWLQNANKYGNRRNGNANSNSDRGNNVNVRFGSSSGRADNDASYKDWLEYQSNTASVKYGANGMYGDESKNAQKQVRVETLTQVQSDSSSQQQSLSVTPELLSASDLSMVSTIDWPMKLSPTDMGDGTVGANKLGAPQITCSTAKACASSSNVTVLVVYGPEYHTHISEMAWNVAMGVHSALQSHIRHHPSSPLHGHIVFGHTSNLTFLDVIDADAIIIGSPVYNGNIHPDVQNWINYWHIDADLSNKFGGAFVTAGGLHAGAEGTISSILRSLMVFQMMAVGGDSWHSPFGVAATMYEDPFGDVQRTEYFNSSCYFTDKQGRSGDHLVHPYFLDKAQGLGSRIANVTVAWKNSSYIKW